MPRAKKSWSEKLADDKDLPKVADIGCKMTEKWGTGRMVIPAPREVDALMREVPFGRLFTIHELRSKLAAKHGVDIACPITTGIFAWISAGAADEQAREGVPEQDITPYWRTLKSGGELNPKYPGGIDNLTARLGSEGHEVVPKGRSKARWVVEGFEASLV